MNSNLSSEEIAALRRLLQSRATGDLNERTRLKAIHAIARFHSVKLRNQLLEIIALACLLTLGAISVLGWIDPPQAPPPTNTVPLPRDHRGTDIPRPSD